MFPHTITIFTYDETTETYSREVIVGVYWESTQNLNNSGKGKEQSDTTSIVIPGTSNSIVKGSYIVKGEVAQITSMADLEQYDEKIQVNSVAYHDAGWDIDNTVIHGS